MVDFASLKQRAAKELVTDPLELFASLPKSNGINDLYDIQSSALREWNKRRNDKDVVIKMPTGSGKTLVGLLIAHASANELRSGSLYLVETNQLVQQTLAQAKSMGIKAQAYNSDALGASFLNGDTIVIGSYWTLFNGRSRFRLEGDPNYVRVGTIILDDAHASLLSVRNACSIKIPAGTSLYQSLMNMFESSFRLIGKTMEFDEMRSGAAGVAPTVLEVPSPEWISRANDVYGLLSRAVPNDSDGPLSSLFFGWHLLRNKLRYCKAIVSRRGITIAPHLPLTDSFPSFANADRRIYMSATFSDDTDIVRTFHATKESIEHPIKPHSLAGVGQRMVLTVPSYGVSREDIRELVLKVSKKRLGSVIEVPSGAAADSWESPDIRIAQGEAAETAIASLVKGDRDKPVVLVNRYDGVDLPGDSCRLVVMDGLPRGRDDVELLEEIQLAGGGCSSRAIAQKIEQGIGRGTRGASDYCAVLLFGKELCEWVKTDRNAALFTTVTRAQITVGQQIIDAMKEVDGKAEFESTVIQGVLGDEGFLDYCASQTAAIFKSAPENTESNDLLEIAVCMREAWRKWLDGDYSKAVKLLAEKTDELANKDHAYAGLLFQLLATIAFSFDDYDRYEAYQKRAHGLNKALCTHIPLAGRQEATSQAKEIVRRLIDAKSGGLGISKARRGLGLLSANASEKDFVEGLKSLGYWLGFLSERYDHRGDGPDVFWLMTADAGLALEAKNEKKQERPLSKQEHGQLLVAEKWGENHFPSATIIPVSVHPSSFADHNAYATSTRLLTTENVIKMRDSILNILEELSVLPYQTSELESRCQREVESQNLTPELIQTALIKTFEERQQ